MKADQLAEKVREVEHGLIEMTNMPEALAAFRDVILPLAKQGEAYEEALAHARSLYHADDQQPSTVELAETVREGLFLHGILATPDGEEAVAALSELVKRGFGHVPVESFAAAMTALEAAQAEVREVRAREQRTSAEGAKRAKEKT